MTPAGSAPDGSSTKSDRRAVLPRSRPCPAREQPGRRRCAGKCRAVHRVVHGCRIPPDVLARRPDRARDPVLGERRHQCLQHTAARLLAGNGRLVPHQAVRRACRPAGLLGIEGPPAALEQPALDTPLELTAEKLGPECAARLTRRSRRRQTAPAQLPPRPALRLRRGRRTQPDSSPTTCSPRTSAPPDGSSPPTQDRRTPRPPGPPAGRPLLPDPAVPSRRLARRV